MLIQKCPVITRKALGALYNYGSITLAVPTLILACMIKQFLFRRLMWYPYALVVYQSYIMCLIFYFRAYYRWESNALFKRPDDISYLSLLSGCSCSAARVWAVKYALDWSSFKDIWFGTVISLFLFIMLGQDRPDTTNGQIMIFLLFSVLIKWVTWLGFRDVAYFIDFLHLLLPVLIMFFVFEFVLTDIGDENYNRVHDKRSHKSFRWFWQSLRFRWFWQLLRFFLVSILFTLPWYLDQHYHLVADFVMDWIQALVVLVIIYYS